jgi:uncharacterized protein YbaR (Trm112 family)
MVRLTLISNEPGEPEVRPSEAGLACHDCRILFPLGLGLRSCPDCGGELSFVRETPGTGEPEPPAAA